MVWWVDFSAVGASRLWMFEGTAVVLLRRFYAAKGSVMIAL